MTKIDNFLRPVPKTDNFLWPTGISGKFFKVQIQSCKCKFFKELIASLYGINRGRIENSIGDLLCYARFTRFRFFSGSFWIFDFFLRQLFSKFVRRCFGRLDGSIRALRKVRFRSEIDNFIESISHFPDGPQRSQMVNARDQSYCTNHRSRCEA